MTRLSVLPHAGSAEAPQVVTLDAFLAGYKRSPFHGPKAVNRGNDRVQVLRYLTEPPERGGLKNRRLSPRAMQAVLEALGSSCR